MYVYGKVNSLTNPQKSYSQIYTSHAFRRAACTNQTLWVNPHYSHLLHVFAFPQEQECNLACPICSLLLAICCHSALLLLVILKPLLSKAILLSAPFWSPVLTGLVGPSCVSVFTECGSLFLQVSWPSGSSIPHSSDSILLSQAFLKNSNPDSSAIWATFMARVAIPPPVQHQSSNHFQR